MTAPTAAIRPQWRFHKTAQLMPELPGVRLLRAASTTAAFFLPYTSQRPPACKSFRLRRAICAQTSRGNGYQQIVLVRTRCRASVSWVMIRNKRRPIVPTWRSGCPLGRPHCMGTLGYKLFHRPELSVVADTVGGQRWMRGRTDSMARGMALHRARFRWLRARAVFTARAMSRLEDDLDLKLINTLCDALHARPRLVWEHQPTLPWTERTQ